MSGSGTSKQEERLQMRLLWCFSKRDPTNMMVTCLSRKKPKEVRETTILVMPLSLTPNNRRGLKGRPETHPCSDPALLAPKFK